MATRSDAPFSHLAAIEGHARFVHMELWNQRGELWGTEDLDPLNIVEPGVALTLKGFRIQTVGTLGEMYSNGSRVQVAGLLDRELKTVSVASARFSVVEQRFTAAHELGHVLLHPHGTRLHRDRPIANMGWQKDPQEQEADFFAACFLVPERQLRRWFSTLFRTNQFVLNDETAFALCTKSLDSLLPHFRTRRDLSLALARTISYNGRYFNSLAALFRVSPTTMAHRLEETGLVLHPSAMRRA